MLYALLYPLAEQVERLKLVRERIKQSIKHRSNLLPGGLRLQPFDDVTDTHNARSFDRHDITGFEKTDQLGNHVLGAMPQSAPLCFGENRVEGCHRLADEKDTIDPGCGERFDEVTVETLGSLTEFEHIAKHRNSPGSHARLSGGEHSERSPHCRGARVVAFIDQGHRATAPSEFIPTATAGERLEFGERLRSTPDIHPGCGCSREHGERIHHPMPSRDFHPVARPRLCLPPNLVHNR